MRRLDERILRRIAMLVAVAFTFTVAVPARVEAEGGGLPLSWLWSWAAAGKATAAGFVGEPLQTRGTGLSRGHHVGAGDTKAAGGEGRAPDRAEGGLEPYSPHAPQVQASKAGNATRGFDPATSRKRQAGANATTEVFENADGSLTQKINGGKVNFRSPDGSWQQIDTRLSRKGDGRWHVSANEIDVAFGTDRLAELTLPSGQSFGYDLAGAAKREPEVTDSTALYRNVLPHTDLEFVTDPAGFKETLILHSPNAASEWVFPLTAKGLTPRLTEHGHIELVDAAGEVKIWLPRGYMQDSKVDPRHGGRTESTNLTYRLDGGNLVVKADESWLKDPARVYPVRVDPTASTWTTGDVFVDNDSSGPDHNGDNLPVGTWNGGSTKTRSFIHLDEFDDDGFVGRRVTAAKLKLYLTWTFSCTTYRAVNVHAATQAWTVANLDVGSYPGPTISSSIGSWTGSASDSYSPACTNDGGVRSTGRWITIPLNVATFENWAKGGTNYGIALTASETDNYAWKRFTSANYSSGQYRPHLELTYSNNVPAQLDARFPANNFIATSLTPQLVARAHDPDGWPNLGLQYKFKVYNDAGTTLVAESPLGGPAWTVPAGKLNWGKTYLYNVQVYDKATYSAVYPAYAFSTPVPQPQLTSRLAQNPDKGFDPAIGNYTTSATDASVETIGPELEIVRSYNSLDLRTQQGFGRGWSSLVDTTLAEKGDTVTITYPDGQEVAFGKEANGTFSAPSGRHSTLAAITGGYTFTDKDATVYSFTQVAGIYRVASITDANGLALTFTYDAGTGRLASIRSASGRSLFLTWSTPSGSNYAHVASVRTDPVVPGTAATALTWTYTYDNDNLTKVCDPDNNCTTYSYTWISQQANAMQNVGPYSYWRLSEPAGASMAASSMQANAGVDNGVYHNVALGQAPAFGNSAATSAAFNGTDSHVQLPGKLITDGPHQTISLWFKTTGSGVLASTQSSGVAELPAVYHPALYVGTDGKLYGQFWSGAVEPMASATAVNDGAWHYAAITVDSSAQRLFLDGQQIGTLAKPIVATNPEMTNAFLGTGRWTNRPSVSGDYGWFSGSISDAAFFANAQPAANIWDVFMAGKWARSALTKITRPSGGVSASISYDMATGRVSSITDENGGVWTIRPPKIEGSSDVYAASVLGGKPANYWRLSEMPGDADAVNEVKGGLANYGEAVTLGTPGPFADATAAAFDGLSSNVVNAAPSLDTSKNFSVSAWVRLTDNTRHQRALTVAGARAPGMWLGYNKDANKWQFTMYQSDVDAPASNRASSTAVAALNTWTKLTGTYDATSRALKLYVNGVLQETVTVGGTKWRAAGPLYIGQGFWTGAAADFWKGSIADVATFHTVLSPEQVAVQWASSVQAAPVAITKVAGGVAPIVMPVATMAVADPGGREISYSYDLVNGYRMVAQKDALGNVTKYGYDVGGFSSLTYDPRGVLTEEIQDVRGNTIQSITCQDQAAKKCSSVYYSYYPDATTRILTPDPRNDVMLTMRDGRSASATDNTYLTTYAYDARGNQTEVLEPLGRKTVTTYNAQGLPVKVVSPGGVADTIEYNAAGDVVRAVDGLGKVTAYTYDGVGRIVSETETTTSYPGGLTTRYTHDGRGRVLTQTEPAVINRVTGATHTSVTTTVYNADGFVLSQTISDTTGGDAARTISNAYNAFGQLAAETDAKGDVTRYEYNAYGHMVKETEPDGGVVVNAYDAEGNLLTSKIIGWTGDPNNPSTPTDLVTASNAYDPAGRLASETDAMGMTTLYTYTDNGLTAKVTSTDGTNTFVVEDNAYDAAGNLISQKTDNGTSTTTFTYDAAGRQLTSTLDPAGLKRTTTHTYSLDDEVLTSTETDAAGVVVGFTEHLYDAEGNPIAETEYVSTALSPVGRWRMAGVKDSSGNSTLTPTGNVTWSTSPRNAAVFDGSGAALSTNGPVLDTARSFSVAAWAYPTEASRNRAIVSQEGSAESGFYLKLDNAAGDKWSFVMYNYDDAASPNTYATSTSVAPLNAWTHVAAVYDGPAKTMRLYVNGVLQTTKAINAAHVPWTSYNPLHIGRLLYHDNLTDPWQGQIGEVQVYQKALTNAEVTSIHSGASPAADAGVIRVSHKLDSEGLPLSETDPTGDVTDYAYDEEGQVVQTTGPAVNSEVNGGAAVLARPVTTIGYNNFGEAVASRDPNGNVTTTAYDAAGQVVSVTEPAYTPPGTSTPLVPVTRSEYDASGNLTATTDELGRITRYGYDQMGRLAKVTAPNTGVTKYTYDLTENVLSVTDPNGVVSSSTYDHLDRMLTKTHAGFTTTYTYDAAGNLASVRTPGGVTQSMTYNAADEMLTSTDGAGGVTRYTYDGGGRLTRTQLPDGTYSTVTYDLLDRATSTSSYNATGGLLATQSSKYDPGGNVIESTDARGTKQTFTYDPTGLMLTARQPVSATDAITISFGYDLAGNRTRFTDGRGSHFISTYNKWNELESYLEPATAAHPAAADRTFTNVYDITGKVAAQQFPGGVRVVNSFDELGRLTRQSGTGAEVATTDRVFTYDLGGRMTSVSGNGGTNTIGYDPRGQVTSITGPAGNSSYAYNADGEMTQRVDAAGTTDYTYDTAGRLKTVVNAGTGVNATLTYNTASRVDRITYTATGNYRQFTYDAMHRPTVDELKTPAGASIAKIAYGWDANGNEISKTTTGFAGSSSNTYVYDLADRLTQWNTTAYAYDKSGNRVTAGAQTFRYDERNRLLDEGDGTAYTYTPRGTLSLTREGTVSLPTQVDAFGQVLRQYSGATSFRDYTYDGLGRVMRAGFAYTGLGNHLAADGDARYTRDPDGTLTGVATTSTQTLAWIDAHTDVVGQFSASGTTLNGSTTYDPLGRILATSGMAGNLGYQSEWTDAFTGRVNMLNRWYNTATGQFDTRDSADNAPVPDSIAANRYQYGDGNPMTVTDPTGHWGWNPFKAVKKVVSKATSYVSHYTYRAYSYAKSKVSHAVSYAKKKYKAVKKAVKKKVRKVVSYVKKKYKAAKNYVKKKYNAAKNWVKKKYKAAKKWVAKKYHSAKKWVKKKYNQVKQAGKKIYSKAKRYVKKAVNTVKDAAKATAKWVKEHKAEIAGFVVGAVVGVGCGALIGWTGVGAVACGALAGAAGSLVTGAMKGHRGWDLVKDALIGGTIGAVTGGLFSVGGAALGAGVRSALSGAGIRAAAGAAGRAGMSAVRGLGSGISSAAKSFGSSVAGLAKSGFAKAVSGATSAGKRAGAGLANLLSRTLPVKVPHGKAVFYSGTSPGGVSARDEAFAYAASTGSKMIDHTIAGRVLDGMKLYKWLPSNVADEPWRMLSIRYASQASGPVRAFVDHAKLDRVFAQVELPALKNNPAVDTINGLTKGDFEDWFLHGR